jgi:hypothetical protein
MPDPALKPVITKTFWKCPSCGRDNFVVDDDVAANGIEHPEHPGHVLAPQMTCTRCDGTFGLNEIRVCGKTPGHAG